MTLATRAGPVIAGVKRPLRFIISRERGAGSPNRLRKGRLIPFFTLRRLMFQSLGAAEGPGHDAEPEYRAARMYFDHDNIGGSMSDSAGARLRLSDFSSGEQAPALVSEILTHQGGDLVVDASGVNGIDAPCIEVLIAAARLWANDDQVIQYENPSEGFLHGLEILGIERNDIEIARDDHGH